LKTLVLITALTLILMLFYNRLTQHMSKESGQEEFGVCKLGSLSTNSPPLPSLGMLLVFFIFNVCHVYSYIS
jgi:hypothetical protein